MRIELLYFEDCPHWRTAAEHVQTVAASRGATIVHRRVTAQDESWPAGFLGSPTILIDGHDPFADGSESVGLSCRLYETPAGVAGSPTVAQLEEVLGP